MTAWSIKEYTFACKLRRSHVSYREIAEVLNRSEVAVRNKLLRPECHNLRWQNRAALNRVETVMVPSSAIEDQAHRYNLRPRSLTALICGDPLPGYSALDRGDHG